MATIESYETATGAKRYVVRYRTPERTQTKRRFESARDAREFAADVEGRKRRGAYVKPSAGRVVFGDVAESWLADRLHSLHASAKCAHAVAGGALAARLQASELLLCCGA